MTRPRTARWWVADCLDDHRCYSIRARTRREVVALLQSMGCQPCGPAGSPCWVDGDNHARFAAIRKIEVPYTDTFDLIFQLLSEGGAL
jgi:hypothetical protein